MRFAANAAPWHVKCLEPCVLSCKVHCVSLLGEGRAGPHRYVPYIVFLDHLVCLITAIYSTHHAIHISCASFRNCKSEHFDVNKSPAALRGLRLTFGSSRHPQRVDISMIG